MTMMKKNNIELLKILEKFPDENPNPVVRFSGDGILLYSNKGSEEIIKAWDISVGDKAATDIMDKLMPAKNGRTEQNFEISVIEQTFLLKAVYVEELDCINVYGSDITARKVINKFPDQNPNPVMRVSKEGVLDYYNNASTRIVKHFKMGTGKIVPEPLIELVGKTVLTGKMTRSEIAAEHNTYSIDLIPVDQFGFIIIYATDITAHKVVDKFPDENPNPVMRFTNQFQLQYYNEASDYIIESWGTQLNHQIPDDMVSELKNATRNNYRLEKIIGDRTYYFSIVEIPEFDFFLMYGTDVTESKAKEMILGKLSKYFSPQVYDSIFTGKLDVNINTTRKNLTIFFSDIKGFTTITEKLEPETLTELITDYLTEMTNIAIDHGGTVDKYIGDAIMIFFGDPTTKGVKDDAVTCVRMAMKMKERLRSIRRKWRSFGIAEGLDIRIGIHTDVCTVGNFGSEDRLDYTVLGNGVNLASRLESAAKTNEILISENTYNIINKEIKCEYIDEISVKGRSHPVKTFQVEDLIPNEIESNDLNYETDGFSVILDEGKIKNKNEIIDYLERSLDHLKK